MCSALCAPTGSGLGAAAGGVQDLPTARRFYRRRIRRGVGAHQDSVRADQRGTRLEGGHVP